MISETRNPRAAFLLFALACMPITATAADEACTGITQKCTKDKTYDKTINGSIYSCYDCTQALCKDGGNGGLSGTATSSVCTEKATTFQLIPLDDQERGVDTLAPKPRASTRPGSTVDPRAERFDEADALFGRRMQANDEKPRSQRNDRANSNVSARLRRQPRTRSPAGDGTSQATDRRPASASTNPVAAAPESPLAAVPLTKAECRTLGGRVTAISVCKTAGNAACRTTDQSGNVHLVCIGEVIKAVDDASGESPIISPNNRMDRPTTGGNLLAAPLTSQECKGLGGTENFSFKCAASLQKACTTVDEHGVVRVACIDEVAD